jgi:hypothetical protein
MTRRTVHHVVAEAVKAAGVEFPAILICSAMRRDFIWANPGEDMRADSALSRPPHVRYIELASGRCKNFWKD